MTEIPDDVMKAARASTVAYFNSFGADAEADAVANKDRDHWGEVQSAAWAIMAERERCARIADIHSKSIADDGMNVRVAMKLVAKSIAAYIRK